MNDPRMEKMQVVMQDKQYVKELMALESIEDIKDKFACAGIDFTTEEIEELVAAVVASTASEDGELSENTLDNVTGGSILGMAIFIGLTAVGVYIGWKAAGRCK